MNSSSRPGPITRFRAGLPVGGPLVASVASAIGPPITRCCAVHAADPRSRARHAAIRRPERAGAASADTAGPCPAPRRPAWSPARPATSAGGWCPNCSTAGHRVRVMTRSADRLRDHPWVGPRRDRRAPTPRDAEAGRRGLRRGRRRLLPDPRPRQRAAASRRPTGAPAEVMARAANEAGVGRLVYLGALEPEGEELSPHLRSRAEVAEILLGSGVPDRRAARRRRPRVGLGVVRDAALPHRAAAGDGHAALGAQPDPADRRPGRAALPRRLRDPAGRRCTAASTSAAPTS